MLAQKNYGCVLLAAGFRIVRNQQKRVTCRIHSLANQMPEHHLVFEKMVNISALQKLTFFCVLAPGMITDTNAAVHASAPNVKFAFNTKPTDTFESVKRVLPL